MLLQQAFFRQLATVAVPLCSIQRTDKFNRNLFKKCPRKLVIRRLQRPYLNIFNASGSPCHELSCLEIFNSTEYLTRQKGKPVCREKKRKTGVYPFLVRRV
jgi:hypothetical protein